MECIVVSAVIVIVARKRTGQLKRNAVADIIISSILPIRYISSCVVCFLYLLLKLYGILLRGYGKRLTSCGV